MDIDREPDLVDIVNRMPFPFVNQHPNPQRGNLRPLEIGKPARILGASNQGNRPWTIPVGMGQQRFHFPSKVPAQRQAQCCPDLCIPIFLLDHLMPTEVFLELGNPGVDDLIWITELPIIC